MKLLTHLTLPPSQVTFDLLDCAGWVNESSAYFMSRLKPPPGVKNTSSCDSHVDTRIVPNPSQGVYKLSGH